MAQVYRFTDENGHVRLMAEIDPTPGGVFNGGTITGKLAVNTTDPLADPIIGAQAPAGAENNGTSLIRLVSDIAASFSVDTDAGLVVTNVSGFGPARVTVSDSASRVQLASVGAAPDTDNAIAVNDGANTFRVLGAGAVITAQHAAPADGTLVAGECALWFDQTDGAAKLMVKAKQADGTVKTAAIALS